MLVLVGILYVSLCTSMLRITTWNMRGAMYGTSYFQTVLDGSDICLLTEHWLNANNVAFLKSFATDFHDPIFSIGLHGSNSCKGSGGTAILIRKTIQMKVCDLHIASDRICGVKLISEMYQTLCIFSILLPSTNYNTDVYLSYLDELCTHYDRYSDECVTIVGGDFNIDLTGCSKNSKLTSLSGFLSDHNLCTAPLLQGRKGPLYTFRTKDYSRKTLLDYICIPEFLKNNVLSVEVKSNCPYDVSDHYPVVISFDLDLLSSASNSGNLCKRTLKWSKADEFEKRMYQTEIDKLLNFDINVNPSNVTAHDVERYSNILTNVLHMSANSSIPCGKFRPYLKPYWKSNNLQDFHYRQRQARRAWKEQNKPRDTNNSTYIDYKDKKREFRKRKRAAERLWQEEKMEDIKSAAEIDIGEFYRTLRKSKKSNSTTSKLSFNGKDATTDESVCELWGEYFCELYTETECVECNKGFSDFVNSKVRTYIDNNNDEENSSVSDLELHITTDEISEQLNTLKCNKAPGPDGIQNEHLKFGGNQTVKYLKTLFNSILVTEYIPSNFRHGMIVPLYKGKNKDKTSPNSYRAVTLTSTLGKLFEKILLVRMQKYLTTKNCVMPHYLQFGFVKNHGSITAIYSLMESIRFYIERQSVVYTVFLDNEKAFDRIWQNGLLYKLWNIGITGKMWRIIYHSYKTATAHVQANSMISQPFRISQGVGQGRVLSAWLFALFINDLILRLLETNVGLLVGHLQIPAILLADDTTILSSTPSGLQTLLNVVNEYAFTWKLKYNATKSNCVIFRPPKMTSNQADINFTLGSNNIKCAKSITYAGTLINSNLKTFDRTNNACKKLKQNLHSLYNIGVNPKGMNPINCSIIWKRIVLPTALYGCEIWGHLSPRETETLEIVQRYFVKFILGAEKTSPNDSCISTLGLWSIEGTLDKFKLLLFGRLCRANHNTTHKQIFDVRLSQAIFSDLDKHSITYDLIKTVVKYDLVPFIENYLTESYIPDKKLWSKIVSQTIEIYEENKWTCSLKNRLELTRYHNIHDRLTPHRLLRLTSIQPHTDQKLVLTVKLGMLAIKSGNCSLCNLQTNDILKHLILNCEKLLDARNEMFYAIVDVLPVEQSVTFFEQDDNDMMISILGGITDCISCMDSDVWKCMMHCLGDHLFKMYTQFRSALLDHRYNFTYTYM